MSTGHLKAHTGVGVTLGAAAGAALALRDLLVQSKSIVLASKGSALPFLYALELMGLWLVGGALLGLVISLGVAFVRRRATRDSSVAIHGGAVAGILAALMALIIGLDVTIGETVEKNVALFWTLAHVGFVALGAGIVVGIGTRRFWDTLHSRKTAAAAAAIVLGVGVFGTAATWLNVFYLPSVFQPVSIVANAAALAVMMASIALVYRTIMSPSKRGIAGVGGVLVIAVLGLVFGLINTSGSSETPAANRESGPNFLLISIDALRADSVGWAESSRVRTPNLQRLHDISSVFRSCFSNSSHTSISFESAFSGVYSSQYDMRGDDRSTLAQFFEEAGYATSGYTTNAWLYPEFGFDRGFQSYSYPDEIRDDGLATLIASSSVGTAGRLLGLSHRQLDADRAEITTRYAIEELERIGSDPFFMWVHYIDPHWPYAPPEMPPELDTEPLLNTDEGLYYLKGGKFSETLEKREVVRRRYDLEVEYLDDQIGALFDTLEQMQLYDNTVIVLWSDHGEEFWEHGNCEHGHTLYDEVLRVPFLIHLPGQREATVYGETVSLMDLMPTLLETAGIDRPQYLSGQSLVPMLQGEASPEDTLPFCFECRARGPVLSGIRTSDNMKAIHNQLTDRVQVFDLATDPGELAALDIESRPRPKSVAQEITDWAEAMRLARRDIERGEDPGSVSDETREKLRSLGYVH